MKKRITVSQKGLAELTPEARMRAFQQDLRALNRLAKVVHKKAVAFFGQLHHPGALELGRESSARAAGDGSSQ